MFCKNCGKQLNSTMQYCKSCGQGVGRPLKKGGVTASDSKKDIGSRIKYGSFWSRLGAGMIDLLIIFLLLVVFYIFFWDVDTGFELITWTIFIVAYNVFFLSIYSSTPGKMIFGLSVVDSETGRKISSKKALKRASLYLVSSVILGVGFLKIAFDKEKHRALHDDLAGTVVTQKKYNKLLAIILVVISSIAYVYVFASYSEEIDDSYTIREGTREIRNQLNLNEELFEGLSLKEDSVVDSPVSSDIFPEVNKKLAAVVSIVCPDNNMQRNTSGSGTLVDESGIILTNFHVVEESDEYYCEIGVTNNISEEPEYIYYADFIVLEDEEGEFLAVDSELDIAFLQIVEAAEGYQLPEKFPFVTLSTSDALNINDKIFVAGYPSYGAGTITYTDGVVSGRVGGDLIKTSAKIDFGNSGGAAFNEAGEYIGIPTMIYEGGLEGLGYIVGVDSVLELLQVMLE